MELSQTESKSLLTNMSDEERIAMKRQALIDQLKERPSILYRNQVIEEVAKEIEKFTAFGQDTIDSLAIYIRGMKK